MYSFSYLEPVCCSMSSSNCCFLTCIQISQKADQVVWYSHHFQNFPQFIVIHTVKGFGIVNKAEIEQEDTAVIYNGVLLCHPSVQFSHSVMSNSLWPHGLQYARLPCPPPTPRVYSKFMSIESMMPSNHLILCRPLLLPPSIFPSIRVFSNESVLCIRWSKY